MLERSRIGKDDGPKYDPQVGAAAAANSALAQRSQDFSEKYFNEHISPLLDEQASLAKNQDSREQQLFDLNKTLTDQANDRYQKYGIPAENAYYEMVKNYSAPEEQENQAQAAIGDQRVAAQGQEATGRRQMAALGIDPSSPAAMAAMSDRNVQNAAVEAAAANHARTAAKTLGMSLTADAANFGRGQASQVTNFSTAANQNAATASNGISQAVSGANSGANSTLAGYGLGVQANSANLNAYTSLQKQQMEQNAAAAAGAGQLLGQVGAAAISHYSDRRLKKNIVLLSRLSTGMGYYEFHYVWEQDDAPLHIGFMADEVEKVWPDAVSLDAKGYKMVDYSKVLF